MSFAGGTIIGAGLALAPYLDFPENGLNAGSNYKQLAVDPSGELTEVLGLEGAWAISQLQVSGLPTSEEITVRLTIDGQVIWNHTWTPSSAGGQYFGGISAADKQNMVFTCRTDFSLEIETDTDTAISLFYRAHPIA